MLASYNRERPARLEVTRLSTFADQLRIAAANIGRGKTVVAEQILGQVLAARPDDARALYLMAAIRLIQQRLSDAEPLLRQSLAADPNQSEAALHLGMIARGRGRIEEAAGWFHKALAIQPGCGEAHFYLGLVHRERSEHSAAEAHFRLAVQYAPNLVEARLALGSTLLDTGRAVDAEAVLRETGTHVNASTQRAVLEAYLSRARRARGDFPGALAHLERARSLAPDLPNVTYNRGDILQHLGRREEAVVAFRQAVAENPLDLYSHRALNALLFCLGRDDEFLRSYDEASLRASDPSRLQLAKGSTLLVAGRVAEAMQQFETVLRRIPEDVDARYGLASAQLRCQQFSRAITEFRRAVSGRPDDPTIRYGLIDALLQAGDPVAAAEMAQQRLRESPWDQSALARLGLAWRICNDAREAELHGFEELIRVYELEAPEGYGSTRAFNVDLEASLNPLHPYAREFLGQSLRHGTQTFGDLFGEQHELVARLRTRIEQAIVHYLAELKTCSDHPFLSRRRNGFKFAGSWSSRLMDRGFHINHIHPGKWISSCYYISAPEVTEDVVARQGWLKFGEPPYEIGLGMPVRRIIQPKNGTLVLFPSFLWHGTTPFHAEQTRTTIAFDVVPS